MKKYLVKTESFTKVLNTMCLLVKATRAYIHHSAPILSWKNVRNSISSFITNCFNPSTESYIAETKSNTCSFNLRMEFILSLIEASDPPLVFLRYVWNLSWLVAYSAGGTQQLRTLTWYPENAQLHPGWILHPGVQEGGDSDQEN